MIELSPGPPRGRARAAAGDRAGPDVEEDLVGSEVEPTVREIDAERLRPGEASVTANQIESRSLIDAPLGTRPKRCDDSALALADRGHIDMHMAALDPVVGGATRQVGDSSTGDHRLGRRAALVDAGPTDMLSLDQCGPPPDWASALANGPPPVRRRRPPRHSAEDAAFDALSCRFVDGFSRTWVLSWAGANDRMAYSTLGHPRTDAEYH